MVKVYTYFQKFDQFGLDIEFNIEHHKKSKTIFGGVLTLICIIIIIGATWATGSELIYKNQPIVDIEDSIISNDTKLIINSTNFPISFSLQDYNHKSYNIEKYFEFEVLSIVTSTKLKSPVSTKLKYENCTYNHFPNFNREYLDNAGILNYQCLKEKNFILGTSLYGDSKTYLSISIKICNKQTNFYCAPLEEIYEWFKSKPVTLNIYFGNNKIVHRNYNHPIYSSIDVINKEVKLSSSKMISLHLNTQEVKTNMGIVFDEFITHSLVKLDHYEYDESDGIDDFLISFRFYASNRYIILHRKYMKLQDLLAEIGGLKNALFMIAQVLVYHYSKIKLNERIINKIYDFNTDREKNANIFNKIGEEFEKFKNKNTMKEANENELCKLNNSPKTRKKSNITENNLKEVSIIEENNQNNFDILKNTTLEKPITVNKFKLSKIHFSLFEIIKILICKKKCFDEKLKYKYELYKIAHNDILYSLDVRNLVKSMEEMKLIKFIIFNFNQLVIFRYVTNVLGSIEERRNFSKILGNIKKFNLDKNKMESFITHYKNENQGNFSDIDERLFHFIS